MPLIRPRWLAAAALVAGVLIWATTTELVPTPAATTAGSRTIAESAERLGVSETADSTEVSAGVSSPASPIAAALTTGSAASPARSEGSANPGKPDHRGPGSVLEFHPDTAPVVEHGDSSSEYIRSYYTAVLAGDFTEAAKMMPSPSGTLTRKRFAQLHAGYEVSSFVILQTVRLPRAWHMLVVTRSPSAGVWNVTWQFVETDRGLQLKDLTYARPGEAGCH